MGKFVPSPLTNLPQTNQTNKDGGSHWTQSLKVRTSKQHNSSILQTNQETREMLNLCKRDRKYQMSWERDFRWLVHDEEKNTLPEIADKSSSLFNWKWCL